ncbi:hypothetical protein DAEQUDRAFT_763503 [Daedalea quercina L-15889]|uniref:Velvet domain-containing protein n=1 Tax=Daedalea quercina L-15889 TaxID=1314783 RepID=A0A165SI62_9APHY|nr:hypothetical protein DAEQUDRAFT_763503 [Daedalea quercina L-15889]
MSTPSTSLQTIPTTTQDSDIGRPVMFSTGHFAGRTIRAQLDELQQAEVGRKCGTKDRRPLDPPPVVNLQLFEVFNGGTPLEEERQLKNLTEMDSHGFLCHVDLFRVLDPTVLSFEPSMNDKATDPPSHVPNDLRPSTSGSSVFDYPVSYAEPLPGWEGGSIDTHGQTSHTTMAPFGYSQSMDWLAPPVSQNHVSPSLPAAMNTGAKTSLQWPELFELGAIDTGATSKHDQIACTQLLVGNTVASPSFIEYTGKDILFAFADLAVCEGGLFLLRYRTFNIFNITVSGAPVPILAECYGGVFRVYNTQNFPGLHPSTELTKRLSSMGTSGKVITRENERKRRRPAAGTAKGKMAARAIAPAPFTATRAALPPEQYPTSGPR